MNLELLSINVDLNPKFPYIISDLISSNSWIYFEFPATLGQVLRFSYSTNIEITLPNLAVVIYYYYLLFIIYYLLFIIYFFLFI